MSHPGICRTHPAFSARRSPVGPVAQDAYQTARKLIAATLAGDRRASHALVRQVGPVIQRRVRAQLRGASMLRQDDLVQEVWSILLANDARLLRAYDGRRSLDAYVGVIARRAARDVVRNAAAQKRGGGQMPVALPDESLLGGDDASPSQAVEARDLWVRLRTHLDGTLSQRGRGVMRCLYTDGRTVDETACLLGITRNAAAIWQTRIRHEARTWLGANTG